MTDSPPAQLYTVPPARESSTLTGRDGGLTAYGALFCVLSLSLSLSPLSLSRPPVRCEPADPPGCCARQEGYSCGWQRPAADVLRELSRTVYPLSVLMERPLPDGVDPVRLETYLSEQQFTVRTSYRRVSGSL